MNVVTNQMSNQNMIELAKQQYEKQQRSKTPGYTAPLPSFGLIYPKTSPLRSGTVEMRHMTSYDEDLLATTAYIEDGTVLTRLIDNLLITEGVSAQDLSNPDLEALCITARIFSYGKMYRVYVNDPKTNNQLEREIDLSKLTAHDFNLKPDDAGEFSYTVETNGDIIKFKYLTIREVQGIDRERPISGLIEKSIQEVNGNRDKNYISEYIKFNLRSGDSKLFREYMSNNMYGLNFNIEFEGENEDTFTTRFRIGPEILWS